MIDAYRADPKPETMRSDEYLEFIRFRPCESCGANPPNDPHHVSIGSTGMGMKPPDNHAIALCRVCHNLEHTGAGMGKALLRKAIKRSWSAWIEGQ
jgi:hypothetical protein